MLTENDKEELRQLMKKCLDINNRLSSGVKRNISRYLTLKEQKFIITKLPEVDNIYQALKMIKLEIWERNKCPICGKFTPFRKNKFCTHCSKECAYISPLRDLHSKQTKLEKYGDANYHNQEKIKQTCLERYGVTSFSKTKDFNKKVKKTLLERYGSETYNNQEKSRKTKLERYGSETYNNQEKSRKTKLERYGSETYNNHIKAKQTCLERYGDGNYNLFGSKSFKENLKNKYGDENYHNKEKTKQTCLERYGVPSFSQTKEYIEKTKQTCLERYGVPSFSQTREFVIKTRQTKLERYRDENYTLFGSKSFKENLKNKYGNENYNNEEKRKETLIQNYGVPYYSQSDEYKSRIQNIWLKRLNTIKKNKTSGYSQPEEDLHEIIKQKWPDVIRQYKCERYPFLCDFYIPSIDVFIELQGTWLHGPHIFNENNKDDINLLNKWIERSKYHKYYLKAIDNWTNRDPYKRQIAKENKLNYLEIFPNEINSLNDVVRKIKEEFN